MRKLTKSEQIEELLQEREHWLRDKYSYETKIQNLEDQLEKAQQKIHDLYAANDQLIHTPEFAADTEAAFERGRQDGIRALASRYSTDTLAMINAVNTEMARLANVYTRDFAYDLMYSRLGDEAVVDSLPETEFTKNMLEGVLKINMKTSETEHSVVQ